MKHARPESPLGLSPLNNRIRPPRPSVLASCILAAALAGCTTLTPEENELPSKFLPRWSTNEVHYDEAPAYEKVGRNIRDGLVGVIDDFAQGLFSLAQIGPMTGFIVQKLSTILGDVIGLLDDNPYSEHIFKGILSRQFLKFGSSASDFLETLGGIHGITINGPEHGILDYVGNETFHTEVYGQPSALTALVGIIVSDFVIRPVGHLIMIPGFRKAGKTVDQWGLDLVEASTKPNFF